MTELLTPGSTGPNGETGVSRTPAIGATSSTLWTPSPTDSTNGPNGALEPDSVAQAGSGSGLRVASPTTSSRDAGQQNGALVLGSTGARECVVPREDPQTSSEDHSGYTITPVIETVSSRNLVTVPNAVSRLIVAQAHTRRDLTPRRWDGTRDTATEIWLNSHRSPHTRRAYDRNIRAWFDWLDLYALDLAEARRGDVDAHRFEMEDTDRPPSGSTIRQRIAAISSFYGYWVDEEALVRNPAAKATRPKALKVPGSIALTQQQAADLLAYVDRAGDIRAALVVRLLLETAVRVSELCDAEVPDLGISSGHRTLRIVRKGDQEAVTPLAISTSHALDTYLDGRQAGPLLTTSTGRPLDPSYLRRLLQRLAKEAGLPQEVVERMHPHVMRHTHATLADEQGVPMQRIQRQLGHADIRQTEMYAGHRQALEQSTVYVVSALLAA